MANITKSTWVEQLSYTLVILIDRQFMLWFPHGFCLGWTQTRWSSALPVQGLGFSTDTRSIERLSWGQSTFMMKKRRMMMTTLTWGWIHTADWPRLWGSPMCFTHVLLSNKVLMASRGISCEGKSRGARFSSTYCTSSIRELIPGLVSPGLFWFCSPGETTHGQNSISSKSEQRPHPWLRDPATDMT